MRSITKNVLKIAVTVFLLHSVAAAQEVKSKGKVPYNQRHSHLFKDDFKNVKTKVEPFSFQRASEIPYGKHNKIYYGVDNAKIQSQNYFSEIITNPLLYLFVFVLLALFIYFYLNKLKYTKRNTLKKVDNPENDQIQDTSKVIYQLMQISELKKQGVITEEEFVKLKKEIINKKI